MHECRLPQREIPPIFAALANLMPKKHKNRSSQQLSHPNRPANLAVNSSVQLETQLVKTDGLAGGLPGGSPHQSTLRASVGHVGRNIERGVYYASGWAVEYGLIKLLKFFVIPPSGASFQWVGHVFEWAEVGAGILTALVFFLDLVITRFTEMRKEVGKGRTV